MATNLGETRPGNSFLVLVLGSIGMLFSVGGATVFFSYQINISGASIWPLPALVLIDWMVLGLLGFVGALFGTRSIPASWSRLDWMVVGALLPLIVFGAFTIGMYVLISLPFLVASAFLITVRRERNRLNGLSFFALGLVCNLVLLFIFVALGGAL